MHGRVGDARMHLRVNLVSNREATIVMSNVGVTRVVGEEVVGEFVSLIDELGPVVRGKMHSVKLPNN